MGVWQRSAIGRTLALTDASLLTEYDRVLPGWRMEDVAGSPYCIQAYEPDPRMGGWPALAAARRELHLRGIELLLDFVPNHTGFDHEWVTSDPERYVLGTEQDFRAAPSDFRSVAHSGAPVYVACGRDPYFPPWRDVAQLNYFNPDTRAAMVTTLRLVAEHCDGIRCDMAMLALNRVFERTWRHLLREKWPPPHGEFWSDATRAVPVLTYLAEVYWDLEGELLDQGFDFAYDKRLLDALHSSTSGPRIRKLLSTDEPPGNRLARFLENHDEPRSVAALGPRLPSAAGLLMTLPGMRFVFDGQVEGSRIRAPVQLGRWPDEPVDEDVRALYDRLLPLASDDLFHDGEWMLLPVFPAWDHTSDGVVAYRWRTAVALAVAVLNVSSVTAQAHVALAGHLPPAAAFEFEDRLTGVRYPRTREALERTGLYVRLEAGGAHLFLVHPS